MTTRQRRAHQYRAAPAAAREFWPSERVIGAYQVAALAGTAAAIVAMAATLAFGAAPLLPFALCTLAGSAAARTHSMVQRCRQLAETRADQWDRASASLHRVAEASGVREPIRMMVLCSRETFAFALRGGPRSTAKVSISTKLLDALSKESLDAVMAHEVAHLRWSDSRLTTAVGVPKLAALWTGLYIVFAGAAERMRSQNFGALRPRAILGTFRHRLGALSRGGTVGSLPSSLRSLGPGAWLNHVRADLRSLGALRVGPALAAIGAGWILHTIQMAVSRRVERRADQQASVIVGPSALADALTAADRCANPRGRVLSTASQVTRDIGPPLDQGWGKGGRPARRSVREVLVAAADTHPPMDERVANLRRSSSVQGSGGLRLVAAFNEAGRRNLGAPPPGYGGRSITEPVTLRRPDRGLD